MKDKRESVNDQNRSREDLWLFQFIIVVCLYTFVFSISILFIRGSHEVKVILLVILVIIAKKYGGQIQKYLRMTGNRTRIKNEIEQINTSLKQKSLIMSYTRQKRELKKLIKLRQKIQSRLDFHKFKNPLKPFSGGDYLIYNKLKSSYEVISSVEYFHKLTKLLSNYPEPKIQEVPINDITKVSNTALELISEIPALLIRLEGIAQEYDELSEYKQELVEYLSCFDQGYQITIYEISGFTGIPVDVVEFLLKGITRHIPKLGRFDKKDLIFICGMSHTLNSFEMQQRSCVQCCSPILNGKCSQGNYNEIVCEVCKNGFYQMDQISSCQQCGFNFHFTHFRESVRLYGICPVCKDQVIYRKITRSTILKNTANLNKLG